MVTNILQIINVQFKENISLDNKKIQYVTKISTSISDISFQCFFFPFSSFSILHCLSTVKLESWDLK